jgi:hypothetical protein
MNFPPFFFPFFFPIVWLVDAEMILDSLRGEGSFRLVFYTSSRFQVC